MSEQSRAAYPRPTLVGRPARPESDVAPRPDAAINGTDMPSLPAIVSDLWQHGERLVKAELELGLSLAKAELDAQVERGKITMRRTAIMSGFFYAGYLTLLAGLVLGLSEIMPAWLAAVGVGLASGLIGYWMLNRDFLTAPHPENTQRQFEQGADEHRVARGE